MCKPLFSVIVPLYCGSKYVKGIIDNLNMQAVEKTDWELILVDDASPDNSVKKIIEIVRPFKNVRLLVNEINRRQGGARNHAVKEAEGEWIVYLDQDDRFEKNAFKNLKSMIKGKSDRQIFAVDLQNDNNCTLSEPFHYKVNKIGCVSGCEYIRKCEVSWAPWNFIYKSDFLREHKIEFVENVRFEDVDYIMRALSKADKVEYLPMTMVIHSVWEGQTSEVGNDFERINDLFKISCRVGDVALETAKFDKDAGEAIMRHHYFMHTVDTKRYLWRLGFRNQIKVLKENEPRYMSGLKIPFLLSVIKKRPFLLAVIMNLVKPALITSVCIKNILRNFVIKKRLFY